MANFGLIPRCFGVFQMSLQDWGTQALETNVHWRWGAQTLSDIWEAPPFAKVEPSKGISPVRILIGFPKYLPEFSNLAICSHPKYLPG